MCKCPVFSHFCCCCPLKVTKFTITNNITTKFTFKITIINNFPNHKLKVGALIIGLIHLILDLTLGLVFTIGAVALEPEDIEEMDNVVKISEGQVQSFFFVFYKILNFTQTELRMEKKQTNFPPVSVH